jgi:hypothetical protein
MRSTVLSDRAQIVIDARRSVSLPRPHSMREGLVTILIITGKGSERLVAGVWRHLLLTG